MLRILSLALILARVNFGGTKYQFGKDEVVLPLKLTPSTG